VLLKRKCNELSESTKEMGSVPSRTCRVSYVSVAKVGQQSILMTSDEAPQREKASGR
jgi:PhoPQ-activated pathogenicity-related protein